MNEAERLAPALCPEALCAMCVLKKRAGLHDGIPRYAFRNRATFDWNCADDTLLIRKVIFFVGDFKKALHPLPL